MIQFAAACAFSFAMLPALYSQAAAEEEIVVAPAAAETKAPAPAAPAPAPAPAAAVPAPAADDTALTEAARLQLGRTVTEQAQMQSAEELFKCGSAEYTAGNYREAIDFLLQACEKLKNGREEQTLSDMQKKQLESFRQLLGKAYYGRALELFYQAEKTADAGNYDEAVKLSQDAIGNYPACKDIMDRMIAKYQKLKKASEYNAEIAYEKADPDAVSRNLIIEREMRRGQNFYKTKQWAKARDHFNMVIREDPYNEMAIDYLRRCHEMLIKAGRTRHNIVIQERAAEAAWAGIAPVVTAINADDNGYANASQAKIDTTKDIESKLKEIIIPNLSFEGHTIQEVVRTLRDFSKEQDKDKVGVNILLLLSKDTGAAKADAGSGEESGDDEYSDEESDDGEETGDEEEASDEEESEDSEETGDEEYSDEESDDSGESGGTSRSDHMIDYLKVEKVDLRQAIELICDAANLRFRIEPHAILIADDNVPLDDYDTEIFIVEKDSLELFDSGEEGEGADRPIQKYFIQHGVTFPTGTALKYDSGVGRLIVTNTPEALSAIRGILDELSNAQTTQVMVQVKFVEVALNDLEELGFEYTVSRPDSGDRKWRNLSAEEQEDYLLAHGGQPPSSKWVGPLQNYSNLSEVVKIENFETETNNNNVEVYKENTYIEWTPTKDVTLWSKDNATLPSQDGVTLIPSTSNTITDAEELFGGRVIKAGETVRFTPEAFGLKNPTDSPTKQIFLKDPLNSSHIYGKAITWGPNSSLVRNAKDDTSAYISTGTVKNDTVIAWSHENHNGLNVNAQVHALDQADSTDILSAPRITTMAGEEAVIKMVTEKYYPDEWEDATVETVTRDSDGAESEDVTVFQPSIPTFGDPIEEGIVLSVTPQVEENYIITMQMVPVIQNFMGWTDYSYEIPLEANGETNYYPNTLKMPIIEARTVNTTVVSYDGETVVLGGVVKDTISMVDDQYPILGDIPLVGRLFQSKGRGSSKTSMLIFMTSRLIKPDGSPIRENQERGVPAFRY